MLKNIFRGENTGSQRAEVKAYVFRRKADEALGQTMEASGSHLLWDDLLGEILLPSESCQALRRNHQEKASCSCLWRKMFHGHF